MTRKLYGLNVLMDLCGGSLHAVQAVLPHYVLKDDGLWLDRQAIAAALALPADHYLVCGAEPDSDLIDRLSRDADDAGLTWLPGKDSGLPALPVPFSAYALAAFMLAGGGLALYERFRDVHIGAGVPASEERGRDHCHFRLSASEVAEVFMKKGRADTQAWLDENADAAREAIGEALRLRAIADEKFGRDDKGVRDAANWLLAGADESTANSAAAHVSTATFSVANERIIRQDDRLKFCESRGLVFDGSARLPDGVGRAAKALNLTRQALANDLKQAVARRIALGRAGDA